MRNIYFIIAETQRDTYGLVLATVTGCRGSTPQKPGSSALFKNDKLIYGTVGGGVVENQVREHAGRCSETGESIFLHFSVDSDISDKEAAVCGGTMTVLIDADPLDSIIVFEEMRQSIADGTPGVLVTKVTAWNGTQVLIKRFWTIGETDLPLSDHFRERIKKEVKDILASGGRAPYREIDLPVAGQTEEAKFFLEPVFPSPHLVIAGAGHIGKALSHLGRLLDFEVTVIDDRQEYANATNLPDADHFIVKDIGEAMRELRQDSHTYIAIVTRGHSHDADALKPCIGSPAAYVGMMGSKKKVAAMHELFINKQWASEEQWKKICTPIGLEIGSQTVEEIAVSIAAQLIQYKTKDKS
jgi:xanthine dehydrogenase accessory factor